MGGKKIWTFLPHNLKIIPTTFLTLPQLSYIGSMFSDEGWLFFKSGFFSYSTKLALVLIGLLYTYIIANALGPASYGKAMFVLAFIGNLVYLFGVEVFGDALIVFMPQFRSKRLFLKFAKILLATFLVLFVLFYLFSPQIPELIGRGNALLFQYALPLFIVFPFFLIFEALFKGMKSFGKVLKVSVAESIANLCLAAFFLIVLHQGIESVIFAKITSVAFASLIYFYLFSRSRFEEKEIDSIAVKRYVKNIFAMSILKKLNSQVVLLYIGLFIPSVAMGLYYIAEKIASYAVEMPTTAIAEAMLPFASGKAKDKKALSSFISMNIKLALTLGIILGFFVLLIGKFLLGILFPNFAEAFWLLPLFILFYLVNSLTFLTNAYRSINRADILVKSAILMLATTSLFGYFLILIYGIYGLLLAQILSNFIVFSFLYLKQKDVGLEIKILPRFKDICFFASLFKHAFARGLNSFGFFNKKG